MRITGNEELNLTEGQEIVLYLGQEFSLEGTNLLKIVPNLKGKNYIINNSGYDIEKLSKFYKIKTAYLKVEDQLIDKAVYLFVQVNDKDLDNIKIILDKSINNKHHILINNPEYYYNFVQSLDKNKVRIHLPILFNHFPILIDGVPKEENPFYYKDLFDIKTYVDLYWGNILEEKLHVTEAKGYLYKYLENIYSEKKKELESILEYKLPSKALDLSNDKYNARPLTLKETIEKAILEGDYEPLPELVEKLIKEDPSQFNNIYDWVKFLECKAPNKVIQVMLENILKPNDVIIDNRFLPLVYEKLAITYQKEGFLLAAAKCYRKFSDIENINGELKNISSNFLRKEVELLYMAGEYTELINIGIEEKLSILSREDAPSVALCLSLAHNELGNSEKAIQFLKGEGDEKVFLRYLYKLNRDEITAQDINKQEASSKLSLFTNMLIGIALMKEGQYLDTIKVFNLMKEFLGNPQNLIGRRVLLIVSLFKARALSNMGNVRESLVEYYNNLESHYEDFEKDNRSIVLAILCETAELERLLGNKNKSLELIEKGLEFIIDENSFYENKTKIKILLTKLHIINELGENDTKIIKDLDEILDDKKHLTQYKPFQVQMNNILVKAYMKNGKTKEALVIVENSYIQYKDEKEAKIEIDLLEMLEIVKDHYIKNEMLDTGIIQLKRIIDKYAENKNSDISIRRAYALKELADHMLNLEDETGAMTQYEKLITEYSKYNYKKLESILQDTIIKKGQISYNNGKYNEVRDSIMEIEGKLDSDIDVSRELLMAKCNEKLGNSDLAISGYEEYLIKMKDKNIFDDAKGTIYKTLSNLYTLINKKEVAIEYLNKLLEIEIVPIGRLLALLDKAKLSFEIDKEKGLAIYEYIIRTFKEETDSNILETLIKECSHITVDLSKMDINLYLEFLKLALEKFKRLSKEAKSSIFESMRFAAEMYEESKMYKNEKALRLEIVKYFGDNDTLDYQLESAYHFNRILEINIDENSINDLESSLADYKSFFIGKEDDFTKDYYYNGLLLYGKQYYKGNEFKKAKTILNEILEYNKDMYIAKLYYGKTLLALGDKKKALKIFKDIVDNDISGELFEAVLEKIRLEKKGNKLFAGNVKKLIREIEERIMPIINASEKNEDKIILGYELARLYKIMKNTEKSKELLNGLVEKYSNYEDVKIVENLKAVYAELEA